MRWLYYLSQWAFIWYSLEDSPTSISQVKFSTNYDKWIGGMKDEMMSMQHSDVWDLVELPKGAKPIGCKWIFKIKQDPKGNIERYKTCSITKEFTQKEGIDFKETFSIVSTKDSFRLIMTLLVHCDLKLHQMNIKRDFLNWDIDETIYMVQLENFESDDSKHIKCKLKKSIYGLKQASRWGTRSLIKCWPLLGLKKMLLISTYISRSMGVN